MSGDPTGRGVIRQSGVIPFRITPGGLEVLLITTSAGRSAGEPRWTIPKGTVEPDLQPDESAVKEAFEEAGVVGSLLSPSVGSYEYDKCGSPCRVEVFLLEVEETLEEWPESSLRDRKWSSWQEARSAVNFDDLRDLIARLPQFLEGFGYPRAAG